MAELNAASDADFCAALDGIWERTPWVVEAVARARPFATREKLAAAMANAVNTAEVNLQLALVCAHPDLAGRLAKAGDLTPESTAEQASAGLDQLTDREYLNFNVWNARYRERFGFPFVVCVRGHTKHTIRAALRRRLPNTADRELRTALAEVRKIAEYRLQDRVVP